MWYPEILNNVEQYSNNGMMCEALSNYNQSNIDIVSNY